MEKRPKDKSKYLNSVELKGSTITQKKFLTSKMSPGVQHTPLPSTSSSKEPKVMEMKILEILSKGILKENRKDPIEHQRKIKSTVNSAIKKLNELQANIIDLQYEEVGETRLNNLMGIAKELSKRLKKLRPQVSRYEEEELKRGRP